MWETSWIGENWRFFMKKTFVEKTFTDCSLLLCQSVPHLQISQRKLSQIATEMWNLWKFSPSKVSRYTVNQVNCVYPRSDDATCLALLVTLILSNFHEVGIMAIYYQMQKVSVMATQGSLAQFAYYCPLYRVVGCPLFRGCLNIRLNGRTVGTFRMVCYIVGVHCLGVSFLTEFYCTVVEV